MKKIAVVFLMVLMVLIGGFAFAEPLMLGTAFLIDEDGFGVDLYDSDGEVPVIELIDLYEDEGYATLYYSYSDEAMIEEVEYEDLTEDYGYVSTLAFYSENLGEIILCVSDDAEVVADELYALMGSVQMMTDYGITTYVVIIATAGIQRDEEMEAEFYDYVYDAIEDYEYEYYGGGY